MLRRTKIVATLGPASERPKILRKMIESGLDVARIAQLTPFTDFFGIGDEIWQADDPAFRLGQLIEAMA